MTRADDTRMLHEALERDLPNDVREAFDDMLESLDGRRYELSEPQRDYVKRILGEPIYENLVSSGKVSSVVKHWHPESAPCTSACPAWVPPALATLPKKPPTRRTA
jgi:hypothetical protein